MNSQQILLCMKQDIFTRDAFRGVFPCDLLMKYGRILPNRNNSFICNTANSRSEGEHWIGIYIDSDGYGEYFDSYGFRPSLIFTNFLETNCVDWTFNTMWLQTPLSTVCGQYCIYWLHSKGLGHDSDTIMNNLNVCNGDQHVLDFVNRHYNGVTKSRLINSQFIVAQISKRLGKYE